MALKNSNSCGIDNLSSNLLKISVNYLVYPLTFLINFSLESGIFPKMFKTAKVLPLYKKGDRLLLENYRPVSLLCSLSKVLEKIVFDKIVQFLTQHNILSDSQHGFRRGRNTQTAIIRFINNLYDNLDINNKCVGLFMDLSKAFDLVSHSLLGQKLCEYGLRGKIHDWLLSYLTDRKQLVDINGVRSKEQCVNIGVPQGSVLGPLLFLIFVNDLAYIDNNDKLTMFADDNTYLMCGSSLENTIESIQNAINNFVQWFKNSKLYLNTTKTVFINFTPRTAAINHSCLIKIEHKSIEQVSDTKFLAIYIDNALNWKKHVDFLCSKLSSLCFAVYRLRQVTNKSIALTFYFSHILSRLRYGIIFWGNSSQMHRIFKVQKRAVRNIVGCKRTDSCRPYFKSLNVLTLPCIYILELLIFVKTNPSFFIPNGNYHAYDTRHDKILAIPAHNLTLYENSPKYMGIKCYNKLPAEIKSIDNMKEFKKTVSKYLIENVYYSVSQYLDT